MVENDENSERRLKLAFKEEFDKLIDRIDKNYQEIIKCNGSLEEILKKFWRVWFWPPKKNEIDYETYI